MNITMFGLPHAYSDPSVYGGSTGADLWAWITTEMLFEGTQRGMFSLLFGAGIILLTTRLEAAGRTDVADIYYRRNLWLLCFGIIHCFVLLWLGEILFYYGLVALFLFAFRNMAPKHLVMIAIAGLLFNAAWNLHDAVGTIEESTMAKQAEALEDAGKPVPEELAEAKKSWAEHVAGAKPDKATLDKDIEAHRSGYLTIMKFQAPTGTYFQSWWAYRSFFDIFSMMMLGMACFKTGLLTLEKKTSTYAAMSIIGYGIGLTTNYFETSWLISNKFSVEAFSEAKVTYDLGRLAMTLGHLGTLLLFVRSGIFGWLRRSLAAVGRMALSNYISHSIICAFVFYGFGFGLYGELQRHELYYVVFSIWLFQLIISPIWLRNFRFGPLEWAWRALTYMKMPAMRKQAINAPVAPAL